MLTSTHLGSPSDVHYRNILRLGAELKAADRAAIEAVSAGNGPLAFHRIINRYRIREALITERRAAGLIPVGPPIPALDNTMNPWEVRFIRTYLTRGRDSISG
jgi:hypothetical protein